jgi:hypothetical protein
MAGQLQPVFVGNTNAFDEAGATAYRDYDVDNVSTYDPGVLVLPVASEAGLAVKVRVHGGVGKYKTTFAISKQGNPPVVPLPKETQGNDSLTASWVNVETPTPNETSGGYDWIVRGEYEYSTVGSPRVFGTDMLPVVSYPFTNARQDLLAAASLQGQPPTVLQNSIGTQNQLMTGGWLWPIMTYPSNLLMNPVLLGNG